MLTEKTKLYICKNKMDAHSFLIKTRCCHDANFVVTGGTVGCRYDNLRCRQWRQIWHYDIPHFQCLRFHGNCTPHAHLCSRSERLRHPSIIHWFPISSFRYALRKRDGRFHTWGDTVRYSSCVCLIQTFTSVVHGVKFCAALSADKNTWL